MTISIQRKIPSAYSADANLKSILEWMPIWNLHSKQEINPSCDSLTIDQVIASVNLSEAFQDVTLRKSHIDPLHISTVSSAIVLQKTLEHLVSQEHELRGFDFLSNDPGIFLIRNQKRPFKTIKRKLKSRWILMNDVTELEEVFTCAGRFSFFKTWQWLLPTEFEKAQDEMKALAAKHNWPILF